MKKMEVVPEAENMVQDLRHLEWDISKISPGTPGMFLKSYEEIEGTLYYYKMSNFDSARGFFGHEAVNEIVAMNIAKILKINCLDYELVHCIVSIAHKEYDAYVTKSPNFRHPDEDKISLETFYELNHESGQSVLEFLISKDLEDFISEMFLLDWLICNRDRHGANIEVLNSSNGFRMAPLFDHGLSFMFSCYDSGENMLAFNRLQDLPVNNYLGSRVLSENLAMVNENVRERFFQATFYEDLVFKGLSHAKNAVPWEYWECILKMLKERVNYAKNFFNN